MRPSQSHLFQPSVSDEFLRDESRSVGRASGISFPRTEAEIVQVLCRQHRLGIPVTIQGARTGLAAGAVPHGGHVLNLSRMNRIAGLASPYLTVEPGVLLAELRRYLSTHPDPHTGSPLFFPPDPTEPTASIGGMVACNASGSRSYGYGAARCYVDGLRCVLSDGDILVLQRGRHFAVDRTFSLTTEGGRVISGKLPEAAMPLCKNTAGYFFHPDMDLIDLLIGSDGTLAVISEIRLKLLPKPAAIWGVLSFFETETACPNFATELRQSDAAPSAIEFFDKEALNILRAQRQTSSDFQALHPIPECAEAAIYTELHGFEADPKLLRDRLLSRLFEIGHLMERCGASPKNTWVAPDSSRLADLLFFRHAVPESVNQWISEHKKRNKSLTKLASDMSVPPDYLEDVFQLYRTGLTQSGLRSAIWGHIGDSHLHVNVLPASPEEYRKGKAMFLNWAKTVTSLFHGSVTAEHGIGKLKTEFLAIQYGTAGISQMRELKLSFDPDNLLSPGNLFSPSNGYCGSFT